MSRASSRLSHHRVDRPHSRIKRPKSAAPFLHPESHMVFEEEEEEIRPRRPHTSFDFYYPEQGDQEQEPHPTVQGYSSQPPDCQACSLPQDPEPLKLAKKYGYGYRKPEKELSPHWSQWPQPPPAPKPQHTDRHHHHHRHHQLITVPPRPAFNFQPENPTEHSVYEPVISNTHCPVTVTSRMQYHGNERSIIMHRGLSPRRAAPPVMPGRSLTQYGGFGQRDYIGSLDLSAPSYNPYRGYNPPVTSRSSSRESRPMHRHLRAAKPEEGYLHNNSIYYSTTPNVTGYFIIHPDWVSERLSMRRSQSLLAF